MSDQVDVSGTGLGQEEEKGIKDFAEDLLRTPGLRVKSLILYGSAASGAYRAGRSDINILAVVDTLTVEILRSVLDPVTKGRRYGMAPFFLTADDIRSSAEVFPLKYLAMKQHYRVLYGEDLLRALVVGREHVLLRIRQRVTNMLLKMRRYYLVNHGQRLTVMMAHQIRRFLETLAFLLSLREIRAERHDAVIEEGAKTFGLDGSALRELSALVSQEEALPGEEAHRLYGLFLEALEKVSGVLDGMD